MLCMLLQLLLFYLRVNEPDGSFGTDVVLVARGWRRVETQHCIMSI